MQGKKTIFLFTSLLILITLINSCSISNPEEEYPYGNFSREYYLLLETERGDSTYFTLPDSIFAIDSIKAIIPPLIGRPDTLILQPKTHILLKKYLGRINTDVNPDEIIEKPLPFLIIDYPDDLDPTVSYYDVYIYYTCIDPYFSGDSCIKTSWSPFFANDTSAGHGNRIAIYKRDSLYEVCQIPGDYMI